MKLGEIKLEAIRIMNINNDTNLFVENLSNLAGEKKYAKYLNNMLNVINKAIDIINHRRVLPQKRIDLSEVEIKKGSVNNRFDISSVEDFLSISRIVYEDNNKYLERVPFEREGNNVVISSKYKPEYLAMVYDTKVDNITIELQDTDEVPGLSDELSRLIPYYIKFELYQEDEPDLALTAKSTFDQGIEALRVYDDEPSEFNIEKIYSSEDCE